MIIAAFILGSISIKSIINRDAVVYMTEISIYINNDRAKLLQKSEMRKDIVIELSYKGFS